MPEILSTHMIYIPDDQLLFTSERFSFDFLTMSFKASIEQSVSLSISRRNTRTNEFPIIPAKPKHAICSTVSYNLSLLYDHCQDGLIYCVLP